MPSKEYATALELTKRQHAANKYYSGKFLRPHCWRIKTIIDRLGCRTVLDYGCGRGDQYRWRGSKKKMAGRTIEELWGIEVTKYDPAYPPYAQEPSGSFDLVICTHVLGIIPSVDLESWVVPRIYGLTEKALYVVLNTGATTNQKKARYRLDHGLPNDWGADEWIDLLSRHRKQGVETTFIARPADPTKKHGQFVIDDAGLRGPL